MSQSSQDEIKTRFTLDVLKETPVHTTVRLFADGGSAGLLTLRNEELADLKRLLQQP